MSWIEVWTNQVNEWILCVHNKTRPLAACRRTAAHSDHSSLLTGETTTTESIPLAHQRARRCGHYSRQYKHELVCIVFENRENQLSIGLLSQIDLTWDILGLQDLNRETWGLLSVTLEQEVEQEQEVVMFLCVSRVWPTFTSTRSSTEISRARTCCWRRTQRSN